MGALIDLDAPESWPVELRDYLGKRHELFLDWEIGPFKTKAKDYDPAITALDVILCQYELIGWHCTRLTEDEISKLRSNGMRLPNGAMLHQRIDALVRAGCLSSEVAEKLKAEHQADDPWRAGRLWFCFFPPRLSGEEGINRFFRHWGGEALYNSHEDNPITAKAISAIGIPCIVEAIVSISSLNPNSWLSIKVARRYLISRGLKTVEPVDHEDSAMQPLPATRICRVLRFPSADFVQLTGCEGWERPIL